MTNPAPRAATAGKPASGATAPALHALVPCAGSGSRSGASLPKQYVPLAGMPLVRHTLQALADVGRLAQVLVVLAPDDDRFDAATMLPPATATPIRIARRGGATRAHSVLAGLDELQRNGAGGGDWVLVHDAARCLVRGADVERLIDACIGDDPGAAVEPLRGGLLAVPVADTLKRAGSAGGPGTDVPAPDAATAATAGAVPARAAQTVDRRGLWAAQTPQMFRLDALRAALQAALAQAPASVTDEASAIERAGGRPLLVEASLENLKVTWPGDFDLAARLLGRRRPPPGTRPERMHGPNEPDRPDPSDERDERDEPADGKTAAMTHVAAPQPGAPVALRIGEGWDIHALVEGRPLILGGVRIEHTHGLLGHSDADALLHAITDAVLGAAALGDIGRHFSDRDPAFAGADSAVLLATALQRVRAAGWAPVNIDTTIVAQAPRLAAHIPAMVARIAQITGLAPGCVNVKAKTAERMGPVGRCEAIEARATCLLAALAAPGAGPTTLPTTAPPA